MIRRSTGREISAFASAVRSIRSRLSRSCARWRPSTSRHDTIALRMSGSWRPVRSKAREIKKILVERRGPYRPPPAAVGGCSRSRHPRVPREVPGATTTTRPLALGDGEAEISARTPALPAPTAAAKRKNINERVAVSRIRRPERSMARASLSFPRSPRTGTTGDLKG